MSTQSETVDQFSAWRSALEIGKPVEWDGKIPSAGYYRRTRRATDRSLVYDAVGIWLDDDGEWKCIVTGGFKPFHFDEIVNLFASVNASPISYDLYLIIENGGAWPDEIAPIEIAHDLAPHEKAAADLKAQQIAVETWLSTLTNAVPTTKTEADKLANYAEAFGKIEKETNEQREKETAPHLKAQREVNEKYKPIIEGAAVSKKLAKSLVSDFAKAEDARRKKEADEENARRQAEYVKAKAIQDAREAEQRALADKGVRVPQFAPTPVVEPPKPVIAEAVRLGTGSRRSSLRTTKTWEIIDATAAIRFLAERNEKSVDFLAAALKEIRILRAAGIVVPGTEEKETTGVV